MAFALRLSAAAQWIRCAFYPAMQASAAAQSLDAEQDNTVREEGTAAHWVAAQALTGKLYAVGDVAPNGVMLTPEIMEGVVEYIYALSLWDIKQWHIERELSAPTIGPNVGGSPDAFGWTRDGKLILADLKMGYRPVDVWPNWQLIGYLAAIIDNYIVPTDQVVEFVIVQPRAYSRDAIQRHRLRAGDIVPYIMQLHIAASAVMMGTPATSGPHCADCSGRLACAVAHQAGGAALEISGEALIQELTPRALDIELQRVSAALNMLTARHEALTSQARKLLREGGILPHWMIGHASGRLGYKDEASEQAVIALGDLLGHDLRKPTRAITPTQASSVIDTSLLETYTIRKRGPDTLLPVTQTMVERAFSNINKD